MGKNKRQGRKRKDRRSGGRKTSLPTTYGCALCEMGQADHCPGCHERLIECNGTAPNCLLAFVCGYCGMKFPGEEE